MTGFIEFLFYAFAIWLIITVLYVSMDFFDSFLMKHNYLGLCLLLAISFVVLFILAFIVSLFF